jgi:hypothetical protein
MKDTINYYYSEGAYHVRYGGMHYKYNNYFDAKAKIDEIDQSIFFHQEVA